MTLTLSHDVSARRLRALTPLPLIALSLTSCGLPKDPDGATARIGATHILRVGISNNPPWAVVDDGQISGIDQNCKIRPATFPVGLINRIVGAFIEAVAYFGSQVAARREPENADPLRIDAPFLRMLTHNPNRSLRVL